MVVDRRQLRNPKATPHALAPKETREPMSARSSRFAPIAEEEVTEISMHSPNASKGEGTTNAPTGVGTTSALNAIKFTKKKGHSDNLHLSPPKSSTRTSYRKLTSTTNPRNLFYARQASGSKSRHTAVIIEKDAAPFVPIPPQQQGVDHMTQSTTPHLMSHVTPIDPGIVVPIVLPTTNILVASNDPLIDSMAQTQPTCLPADNSNDSNMSTVLNDFCPTPSLHPSAPKRRNLWPCLRALAPSIHCPWILLGDFNATLNVFGDFNATLNVSERKGGAASSKPSKDFHGLLMDYDLCDMGYQGPDFTWSRRNNYVQLDRIICNFHWDESYPETVVSHLLRIRSDQRPLLLRVGKLFRQRHAHIRYLSGWQFHDDFDHMVQDNWLPSSSLSATISHFTASVDVWNRIVFGYIASCANAYPIVGYSPPLPSSATNHLDDVPSPLEIREALFDMAPLKAPCPDGLHVFALCNALGLFSHYVHGSNNRKWTRAIGEYSSPSKSQLYQSNYVGFESYSLSSIMAWTFMADIGAQTPFFLYFQRKRISM
ncbi:hypothetical protein V6N13_097076 [Hibiscus sabdariffa]